MKILSKYMGWDSKPTTPVSIDKPASASNDPNFASTEGGGGLSSDEILHKLFSANNGHTSQKLFNGDTSGHNDDRSSADLALVNNIAFYTQDPEQIDQLFRQSKLLREKWDEVHLSTGDTYGEMTINKALSGLTNTYSIPNSQKASISAFQFISGKQLLTLPMKTDWLIEGYIPSDATIMLFGAPASGKSLIALEMGCCIASGSNWHGQSVKQGAVAYIAGEGFNGLSKRLNALVLDKKLSVKSFHSSKLSMDLFNSESTTSVLNAAKKIKDLRLIIVDTLHRNFTGDENQSSNFAIALQHCDALRDSTGATVMLVHHSGHKSSDRGRGSSSMTGAMDAEFKVKKANNVVTLSCTKMKDDEEPSDKAFSLESLAISKDENGEDIYAPILKKMTVGKSFNNLIVLTTTDLMALNLLSEISTNAKTPVSRAEWKSACMEKISVKEDSADPVGSKSKQFSRSVSRLLKESKIIEREGCFIVADAEPPTEEINDS